MGTVVSLLVTVCFWYFAFRGAKLVYREWRMRRRISAKLRREAMGHCSCSSYSSERTIDGGVIYSHNAKH